LGAAGSIVKRHWRLIVFLAGLLIVCIILWALREVLFPFAIALALAYLLLPALRWAERKLPQQDRFVEAKRALLVILFITLVIALVVLVIYLIIDIFIEAFTTLITNAPSFITSGIRVLREWLAGIRQLLPTELQSQMDAMLADLGNSFAAAIQNFFRGGILSLPSIFNPLLSILSIPIFLFYLLKDSARLNNGFYSGLPQWLSIHVRNLTHIIEVVLGRYIRAQLLLGFIVGYACFLVLFILRVPFAPTLGVIAGITELIPILGPWIGGAIAFTVTLATVPDKALLVALLFLVIQLFENNLLVPRIHGYYMRIHPAITLVLLVIGAYVAGIWGVILIVPFTATALEIYRYIRQCIRDNQL